MPVRRRAPFVLACAARPVLVSARDARVGAVLCHYGSRPDLALSTRPKRMALMEGQPYSLAFRRSSPKFSGLLWSYCWLQMAVDDALIAGDTPAAYRDDITQVASDAMGDMMGDAMGAAAMGGTARQAFARPPAPSRDR